MRGSIARIASGLKFTNIFVAQSPKLLCLFLQNEKNYFQLINYSFSELGHRRFSWFIDQRSEIMDSNIKKGERSEKMEKVGGEKEGEVWGKEEKWRKKKEEEEVLIGRGVKTKRIGIAARMWAKSKLCQHMVRVKSMRRGWSFKDTRNCLEKVMNISHLNQTN